MSEEHRFKWVLLSGAVRTILAHRGRAQSSRADDSPRGLRRLGDWRRQCGDAADRQCPAAGTGDAHGEDVVGRHRRPLRAAPTSVLTTNLHGNAFPQHNLSKGDRGASGIEPRDPSVHRPPRFTGKPNKTGQK